MPAPFLNARRLRDYPRLIALATWGVLGVNTLFHRGWFGGFGGILSFDFLAMYSAGYMYRHDLLNLYNFQALAQVEQQIFAPTPMQGGANIFSYPPYVAMLYSPFTHLEYAWAFILWVILSIGAALGAAYLLQRWLVAPQLDRLGLTASQMVVLVMSFAPVVLGIFLGQNNTLTLLLISLVLVLLLKGHPFWAGLAAGLLVYKPHFLIGLGIIWLVWKQWRTLLGCALTAGSIAGSLVLLHGIEPYRAYLAAGADLLYLPQGTSSMQTTLFALVASLLPENALPGLWVANIGMLLLCCVLLGWLAYRYRRGEHARALVTGLAILFPFFAAPHSLHYDLVLLLPPLVLWSRHEQSRPVLWAAIVVYLGAWLLIGLTRPTDIGLLAVLPLGLGALLAQRLLSLKRVEPNGLLPTA